MSTSKQKGATLSEYAFLISLVVVASLASVNLLGHSTSELLGGVTTGQTGQQMEKLVSLEFGGSAAGGANTSTNTAAVSGATGTLQLTDNNTGGGVNVSSAEGLVIKIPNAPPSVNGALTTAQQFDNLVNNAKTPQEAALYKKIANNAYFLASAQANYEVNVNGQYSQTLKDLASTVNNEISSTNWLQSGLNMPLKAIDDGMTALASTKNEIIKNKSLTAADKEMALSLIDSALTKSQSQYGNTMRYNPLYKLSASVDPPKGPSMDELREIAVSASVSGELPVGSAVDTSVQTGVTIDTQAK
jgi:hypothetical protein